MHPFQKQAYSPLVVADGRSGEQVWLADHWTLTHSRGTSLEIRPDPEEVGTLADRVKQFGESSIKLISGNRGIPAIAGLGLSSIELAFGYFVRTMAEVLVVRRKVLRSAVETLNEPMLLSGLSEDEWHIPSTSKSFQRLSRSSLGFNRQLFSLICQSEGVPTASRHEVGLPPAPRISESAVAAATPRGRFRKRLLRCRREGECRHTHCSDNLFTAWHFGLLLALTGGAIRIEARSPSNARTSAPDRESRKTMFSNGSARGVDSLLSEALTWLLPTSLLEDLDETVAVARRTVAPMRWIGPVPNTDAGHVRLAVHNARGTEIHFAQHGGFYGEATEKPSEVHERSSSVSFVTWGWRDHGSDSPMPAPRLAHRHQRRVVSDTGSRMVRATRAHANSILWVTQDMWPFDYRLPPPSTGVIRYWESRRRFREGLTAATEKRILVRGRPHKFDAQEDHFLDTDVFDGLLKSEEGASIHQLMEEASLVVLDRAFTTTFLECLSRRIPVLVFDPDSLLYTREGRTAAYRALAEAGIVHADPLDAASLVNAIAEDAWGWWSEGSRRTAVAEAARELALTGPKYFRRWASFLRQETSPPPGES